MRKSFLVLILLLPLTGCLAGAFVAGGAATGGLVTDPRSLAAIKSDEEISFKVNRKLANDPVLSAEDHISATSYNQVVLLTGQAYDQEMRGRAGRYAMQTPGVRRVFNKVTLGIPSSSFTRARDVGITSAVKMRMFADTDLKSNSFKVVTESGIVYILGIATPGQARLAATIARRAPGVVKVVKLIEESKEA